jgi:hypothetical protein
VRTACLILSLTALAAPLAAQSEDQLRSYFEGRHVRVKLDLPGSQEGVDVWPERQPTVDFPRYAGKLKQFGTAIRRGDEAMVTKVRIKDDHIEFQLDGGGYGTLGDDTSPYVPVRDTPKTEREKNLERDLPKTTDPEQKQRMREELDRLRKGREREDARNRTEAEQARQIKEANIRQRRQEGGSRFNLRWERQVPADALTPEAVQQALAEYVDFSGLASTPAPAGGIDQLRKGMSAEEVDAMLGRPESIAQRMEGTLSVSTSIYRSRDRKVMAEFVEGVLIRFTISSP